MPIPFLALSAGTKFQLGIIPRDQNVDVGNLVDTLASALEVIGIGAKTSAGYGRFRIIR